MAFSDSLSCLVNHEMAMKSTNLMFYAVFTLFSTLNFKIGFCHICRHYSCLCHRKNTQFLTLCKRRLSSVPSFSYFSQFLKVLLLFPSFSKKLLVFLLFHEQKSANATKFHLNFQNKSGEVSPDPSCTYPLQTLHDLEKACVFTIW